MRELLIALRRVISQPAFVVVAVVLLVAAVGLNGATQYMQLHFRKLPVPPAQSLTLIPQNIGPWMQVSIDEALSHDFLEALGTDKFVFRDYVDTRLISPKDLAQFKDKTPHERKQLVGMLQLSNPAAVVNCSVTYYTGLVDTVAHIPERCYIADGYEPSKTEDAPWPALQGRPGKDMVRYIVFEDSTPGRRSITRNVAYFFNCNGQYMSDSIAVRKRLADLSQKYGYYMKIEMQTLNLAPEDSTRVMNEFLTHMLPQAEKCLPDWKKLNSGTDTGATSAAAVGS